MLPTIQRKLVSKELQETNGIFAFNRRDENGASLDLPKPVFSSFLLVRNIKT